MISAAEILKSYWTVFAFAGLVLLLNMLMILLAFFTGERHNDRVTGEIYESGISAGKDSRTKFSVHYYLVAMFFVIFDVESVFIIAWAITFRDAGWAGYWGMFIFITILLITIFYEWKTGALDFGPDGKKILKAYHEKFKSNIPE
jgi:NADH-quinone oxidoreductase subunit A